MNSNHQNEETVKNTARPLICNPMKPTIKTTRTGKIAVNRRTIDYDFYIDPDGNLIRRKMTSKGKERDSLSILTLDEAGRIYDPVVNEMIIGCPSDCKLRLSNEATDFFEEKRCKIKLLPLREAIEYWNNYEGKAIGLFHLNN